MRLITLKLQLILCLVAISHPVFAAVIDYPDRSAFEAAVGAHVTYSFDTSDGFATAPAPLSSIGPVSTWSPDAPAPAYLRPWPEGFGNQVLSGAYNDATTSRLVLAFNPPQFSVGFDIYTPIAAVITVRFADNSFASFGTDFGLAPDFIGVTSDLPIVKIVVQNDGDGRAQQWKGIDNLTVVPEPTGLMQTYLAAAATAYNLIVRCRHTSLRRRACKARSLEARQWNY